MKKSKRTSRKPAPRGGGDRYEVGYGRPPKAGQFRPGQSGNPAGKPKGTKNHDTILHDILFRKIPIRDRGKVRHVPVIEAIFLKFTEEALRANPRAATFLMNRYAPKPADEVEGAALSGEEEEIIAAFARRIRGTTAEGEKS